jgi:methionyl-tRNA formyltransferase
MRIVFFGTPEFAVCSLKNLFEKKYDIAAVVTAPDKPSGRGLHMHESAVKKFAKEKNLKIFQPEKLKDEFFLNDLKLLNADLFIVIAFRMLPETVWKMPPIGTFNLHGSLLPKYRGAAPINWAIINGEKETGVTTFFLKHEIDTGDIILQKKINIPENMNATTLHDVMMHVGADAVLETIEIIESKKYSLKNQIGEILHAPKIFKNDCKINWNQPVEKVYDFIRGLSIYPAAWTLLNEKTFKIFSGKKIIEPTTKQAGEIITDNKTYLKFACDNGYYEADEVQLEGKQKMSVTDFLKGWRN